MGAAKKRMCHGSSPKYGKADHASQANRGDSCLCDRTGNRDRNWRLFDLHEWNLLATDYLYRSNHFLYKTATAHLHGNSTSVAQHEAATVN
jgi:hypothetical protein